MQELLTGKRRLPGFEGEWEVKRLGDCVDKIAGGGTPSRSNSIFWGDEIPWATVKDLSHYHPKRTQESITRIGLNSSSSCLIPAGTLIASTRMALGKAVIYEVDVAINQDLKAICFKKSASARFFYYWFQFNAPAIDAMGGGSTVKGISTPQLKNLRVPDLDIEEQNAIAEVLGDLDIGIGILEARLSKVRGLKLGMMQELLAGRIRLL
jgi:type I restriction enzyme S subunit